MTMFRTTPTIKAMDDCCGNGHPECCQAAARMRARNRMAGRTGIVLGDDDTGFLASLKNIVSGDSSPSTGTTTTTASAGCASGQVWDPWSEKCTAPQPGASSSSSGSSAFTSILGTAASIFGGALAGAQTAKGIQAQQQMILAQQRAKAQQMKMLLVVGMVGVGAILLLRR